MMTLECTVYRGQLFLFNGNEVERALVVNTPADEQEGVPFQWTITGIFYSYFGLAIAIPTQEGSYHYVSITALREWMARHGFQVEPNKVSWNKWPQLIEGCLACRRLLSSHCHWVSSSRRSYMEKALFALSLQPSVHTQEQLTQLILRCPEEAAGARLLLVEWLLSSNEPLLVLNYLENTFASYELLLRLWRENRQPIIAILLSHLARHWAPQSIYEWLMATESFGILENPDLYFLQQLAYWQAARHCGQQGQAIHYLQILCGCHPMNEKLHVVAEGCRLLNAPVNPMAIVQAGHGNEFFCFQSSCRPDQMPAEWLSYAEDLNRRRQLRQEQFARRYNPLSPILPSRGRHELLHEIASQVPCLPIDVSSRGRYTHPLLHILDQITKELDSSSTFTALILWRQLVRYEFGIANHATISSALSRFGDYLKAEFVNFIGLLLTWHSELRQQNESMTAQLLSHPLCKQELLLQLSIRNSSALSQDRCDEFALPEHKGWDHQLQDCYQWLRGQEQSPDSWNPLSLFPLPQDFFVTATAVVPSLRDLIQPPLFDEAPLSWRYAALLALVNDRFDHYPNMLVARFCWQALDEGSREERNDLLNRFTEEMTKPFIFDKYKFINAVLKAEKSCLEKQYSLACQQFAKIDETYHLFSYAHTLLTPPPQQLTERDRERSYPRSSTRLPYSFVVYALGSWALSMAKPYLSNGLQPMNWKDILRLQNALRLLEMTQQLDARFAAPMSGEKESIIMRLRSTSSLLTPPTPSRQLLQRSNEGV